MECNTSYGDWYEQILNVTNTEVNIIRNVDTYEVQETVSCLENHGLLALRQLSMFKTCKQFCHTCFFLNISISVGDSDIHSVPIARNFGCWFDSRLSMASRITKLFASLFYHIYNIYRIRKYLSRQSAEILVNAFITSRLDYCNGLYMCYKTACWINCNEYRTLAPDWFLENRNFVI